MNTDEAWTKAKIDSLFFHWISSQQGADAVRQLVEQTDHSPAAAAAAAGVSTTTATATAPPTRTTSSPNATSLKKIPPPALDSSTPAATASQESTPPTPTTKKTPVKKPSPPNTNNHTPSTTPLVSSPLHHYPSPTLSKSGEEGDVWLHLPAKLTVPSELVLANRQQEIDALFDQLGGGRVSIESFAIVCQSLLKLSFCLVVPLFRRIRVLLRDWKLVPSDPKLQSLQFKIDQDALLMPSKLPHNPAWVSESMAELLAELEQGYITKHEFCEYWRREIEPFPSYEERLFRLIKSPYHSTARPQDFFPVLKELIDTHPGLEFLETAPEFQEKYARTVVARIFQRVNLNWSGEITLREWLKSDFPHFLDLVSSEDEINSINEYFSYEHFYVIYCKFWELDSNHDFTLTKDEFARFSNHSLTRLIVDRIFAQVTRKFASGVPNRMGYEDFCFFLLCEEDKTTEPSLRYWFDLVDLNLDGQLSPWEIRVFYEEQLKRMCHFQPEDDMATFEDLCCQLKDSLCPSTDEWHITVREFIKEKQTSGVFLNQLFNLAKFLNYETRDPFAALKLAAEGIEVPIMTDWDRFALQEYAKLAGAEEARTISAITPEIVAQLVEEMEQEHQQRILRDDREEKQDASPARQLPLFAISIENLSSSNGNGGEYNVLSLFRL
ncbi:hypothetical protein BASA81_012882 [Batrachochytrium salamandrivorans]|nr:hypothetical protein BASA81_012882 [Batrachochytrium salamandrivorans]